LVEHGSGLSPRFPDQPNGQARGPSSVFPDQPVVFVGAPFRVMSPGFFSILIMKIKINGRTGHKKTIMCSCMLFKKFPKNREKKMKANFYQRRGFAANDKTSV
jgi:hypothetical protein